VDDAARRYFNARSARIGSRAHQKLFVQLPPLIYLATQAGQQVTGFLMPFKAASWLAQWTS
jgi:hypothetical protein